MNIKKNILLLVCDVRVEYMSPSFKIHHFQAKLQERVQNKRRDSWNVAGLLNQDKAFSVCQFLTEKPNTNVQTRSILVFLPRTTSVFSQT